MEFHLKTTINTGTHVESLQGIYSYKMKYMDWEEMALCFTVYDSVHIVLSTSSMSGLACLVTYHVLFRYFHGFSS